MHKLLHTNTNLWGREKDIDSMHRHEQTRTRTCEDVRRILTVCTDTNTNLWGREKDIESMHRHEHELMRT